MGFAACARSDLSWLQEVNQKSTAFVIREDYKEPSNGYSYGFLCMWKE